MSFSRFRRHQQQAFSPTSSASLSPTTPILESPITFQALTSRLVPEVSLRRKKKQDKSAAMPPMFPEVKDDEDVPIPNVVRVSSAEYKAENAGQTNVEAGQGNGTRIQYFDNIFNSHGPLNSPRTMAIHDSIVVVEIKTNTRVKEEEFKLVSDLSFRLAQIYQRPETSMMVTIQQDICLHFGNSSLPAYLMKVSAHPYIIAPVTNMRNTALIQKTLHEFLGIASNRGVIIYTAVSEENFATNGITTMGEAVRINSEEQNDNSGFFKTITRSISRRKKTSSSSSAPLSIETSSSWAPATESNTSASISNKEGQKDSSATSEEPQPQTVRRSRSLRDSVCRRVEDLGPQDETQ